VREAPRSGCRGRRDEDDACTGDTATMASRKFPCAVEWIGSTSAAARNCSREGDTKRGG
jgi:hypothetical protein